MLLKADRGHIVNTCSVNGFWASLGPTIPHTAYSAAKFAVKGFTEALLTDLRINAPHIKCSVVMPGHIGTSIVTNSRKIQSGNDSDDHERQGNRPDARARRLDGRRRRRTCRTATSPSSPTSARGASSRRRRPAPPRPPRSSSTASRPTAGASWSATTPNGSTSGCARPRNAPTTSISSRVSPRKSAGKSAAEPADGEPPVRPLVSLYSGKEWRHE